jgi:hypothetical protein
MDDLYKKNYEPLKKEIEEDFRRWKDLLFSWIGRIKSNLHVQCIPIPIKIPMIGTIEIEKSTLKFI